MATTVGMSVEVVTTGDIDTLLRQTQLNVRNALKAMADATLQRALIMTPAVPVREGDLKDTGIAFMRDDVTSVCQFGEGLMYGRYQEYGSPNPDEPWNYTTAGTGAFFLQTSGNSVAKEGIKKFL